MRLADFAWDIAAKCQSPRKQKQKNSGLVSRFGAITNSPAQLLADQVVIGRERLRPDPAADGRHHSVLAHRARA